MAQAPKVVAGYQRDVRSRLVLAILPGALAWGVGATILLFGLEPWLADDPARFLRNRPTFRSDTPRPVPARTTPLVGIGALMCLLSPFVFAFGLRRSLDNDHYLLLRTDGLVRREDGTVLITPWDDIEDASVDAEGRLVVHLHDDEFFLIEERFIGTTNAELASKVREIRRKALWGLLSVT
jgi:hypothetical protein